MHIRLIGNKVTEYIIKRKLNFVLTLLILTVSIYMVSFVFTTVCESNYYIYKTKEMLKGNIININIMMDGLDTDYCKKVSVFANEINELYGDDFGKYMYMETNCKLDNIDVRVPMLYVDATINDLCEEDTIQFNLEFHDNDDYTEAYVGYHLRDTYPVGTILMDNYTRRKVKIVECLPEGAEWVPSLLFHTYEASVVLDDYLITTMDEGYFELNDRFLGNTFNAWFIQYELEEEEHHIKKNIRELAEKYGITCYTYTLEEMIELTKEENEDFLNSLGILLIFTMTIAILAYISAAMADAYSRRRELAIMYINKVSLLDIFGMFLVENTIKFVISIGIASFLFVQGLSDQQAMIYRTMVLPVSAILIMLFLLALSMASCKSINSKKVLSFIGGERI